MTDYKFEPPASLLELRKYGLIYCATPYSKYPAGIFDAFKDASRYTGRLVEYGLNVYSPIAHTHALAIHGELDPFDHNLWMKFDRAIMGRSDALLIIKMKSWDVSKGIAEEFKFFRAKDKPIHFLNQGTLRVDDNYEGDTSVFLDASVK